MWQLCILAARGHFNVLMQTLIRVAVCKAGHVPRPHARTETQTVNLNLCSPQERYYEASNQYAPVLTAAEVGGTLPDQDCLVLHPRKPSLTSAKLYPTSLRAGHRRDHGGYKVHCCFSLSLSLGCDKAMLCH